MSGHPIKFGDWRAVGWEISAGLELGSSAGGWCWFSCIWPQIELLRITQQTRDWELMSRIYLNI